MSSRSPAEARPAACVFASPSRRRPGVEISVRDSHMLGTKHMQREIGPSQVPRATFKTRALLPPAVVTPNTTIDW